MFRKWTSLLIVAICLNFTIVPAFAENTIQVYLEDSLIDFDVPPLVKDGRLLVPMRSIFEKLGAELNWDSTEKRVTATKGEKTIVITIGNKSATINNQSVVVDTTPIISRNRVFVPLRFVGEALGVKVYWDEQSRTVTISQYPKAACDEEHQILSVVQQFFVSADLKDADALTKLVTDNYIKEKFGSMEKFRTYHETSDKGKALLVESVLFELRDSNAVVYFMGNSKMEGNNNYFSGYMNLKQTNERWLIDYINESEAYPNTDQTQPQSPMKTERCGTVNEESKADIIAVLQQYKLAIEEGNEKKLSQTMDENMRRLSFKSDEDPLSDSMSPTKLDYFTAEVVQTNGEIAYAKVTLQGNSDDENSSKSKFLFTLRHLETGWKICDSFWFVNPLPTEMDE
jgi:hypothetical protein